MRTAPWSLLKGWQGGDMQPRKTEPESTERSMIGWLGATSATFREKVVMGQQLFVQIELTSQTAKLRMAFPS